MYTEGPAVAYKESWRKIFQGRHYSTRRQRQGAKAAMAVSLIVGLVRAFAPIVEDPGQLLGEITVLTLILAAAEAALA
jgi:hypothetical protein